jgi:hypothetical protein
LQSVKQIIFATWLLPFGVFVLVNHEIIHKKYRIGRLSGGMWVFAQNVGKFYGFSLCLNVGKPKGWFACFTSLETNIWFAV